MADSDTNTGLGTSELVGLAAAATVLISTVGALAVTGAVQEMQRERGWLLTAAFACVLGAAAAWALATLWKSREGAKPATPSPARSRLGFFAEDMTELEQTLVDLEVEKHLKRATAIQELRDRQQAYAQQLAEVEVALPDNPAQAMNGLRAIRTDLTYRPFSTLQGSELTHLERLIEGGSRDAKTFAAGLTQTAALFDSELQDLKSALEQKDHPGYEPLFKLTATSPAPRLRRFGTPQFWQGAAIVVFGVGILVGIIGMILTQGAQDRPSLIANYVEKSGGEFIAVNATAHNVGSGSRLFVQISGFNKVGDRYQRARGVPPWWGYSGPDSGGNITQKFNWRITRAYDAYEISATTSDETACVGDRVTRQSLISSGKEDATPSQGAGQPNTPDQQEVTEAPQSTLPGCVFLVLPPRG